MKIKPSIRYLIYGRKVFPDHLFKVNNEPYFHYVDIWNHKLLSVADNWIPVETDAFNINFLGTDNEGSSGCVAKLPVIINASVYGDQLNINAGKGTGILIWPGCSFL